MNADFPEAVLYDVASQFATQGEVVALAPIETGHINNTYRVDTVSNLQYVLQRINHDVFPDPELVIRNSQRVTAHLQQHAELLQPTGTRRHMLQLVDTNAGGPLLHTPGGWWRMYDFIENSYTIDGHAEGLAIREAAFAFAQFARLLTDMPGEPLQPPITDFHNGAVRFQSLLDAIRLDKIGRAQSVRSEIDRVICEEVTLCRPQQLIERGKLPQRTVHNDTKCNNVLLDQTTHQALCVIDIDLVMPGLSLFDFGDLVRTTASRAAEDEPDLSQVTLEIDRIEQAVSGYLAGWRNALYPAEVDSLADGPAFMALIMATRFLTDYLEDDVYYHTERSGHNLDRCRTQLHLFQELQRQRPQIVEMLKDHFKAKESV